MTSVEGMAASLTEGELVRSLREGDEHAFVYLLERYHGSLVCLARTFVQDPVWAEEVTRDTWLGVLRGLGTFRGDVSLRMWLHRVLIDTARTRVVRENRSLPFSTLDTAEGGDVVGSDRFLADGRWASPPRSWRSLSEENPLERETFACIRDAIAALPPVQRRVITLRDVEGWPAEEVCTLLDLPDTHQRALLHRARSKVRAALEWHLEAA